MCVLGYLFNKLSQELIHKWTGLVNVTGALWKLSLLFHLLNITTRPSSHAPFVFGMFISGFFQREGKLDCRKNVYVHPKANHKLLRETFLSELHVRKSVLACQTIHNSFENCLGLTAQNISIKLMLWILEFCFLFFYYQVFLFPQFSQYYIILVSMPWKSRIIIKLLPFLFTPQTIWHNILSGQINNTVELMWF